VRLRCGNVVRAGWLAVVGLSLAGAAPIAPAPSVPAVDAPELAKLGSFDVGTSVIQVATGSAPSLTGAGQWADAPRSVAVRLWYPAGSGGPSSLAAPMPYRHTINARGSRPVTLVTGAIAHPGAVPRPGKFPLVLISHGFRGWGEAMSYLGENLASKGYVVAAIDHGDVSDNDPAALALTFGNVLLQRSADQKAVLAALVARSDAVGRSIDRRHIGLIGYSMGGYGALATAGAGYDPASPVFAQLPPGARARLLAPAKAGPPAIEALVTIAPWGGQPTSRAWTAASLAGIRAPLLMIDGEEDDVVDFRGGVRWIYGAATRSDRRLLTYEAARHNVGNNAPAPGLPDFGAVESQTEPVWRGDRLNAINVHFITAFLNWTLKGDAGALAFLDVPTPRAVDGVWAGPAAAGSGTRAGSGQPTHWRGFQRRWAIGLGMSHAPAVQAP
jgi:dienelactone hydrolase